jgi:hypothetical protein
MECQERKASFLANYIPPDSSSPLTGETALWQDAVDKGKSSNLIFNPPLSLYLPISTPIPINADQATEKEKQNHIEIGLEDFHSKQKLKD